MLIRTVLIAFAVTALFSSNVEAQLFRFGRVFNNGAQSSYQQQAQRPSTYDPAAYQYNNPPQRATYVPSQRTGDQASCQRPPCPNDRTQLVARQGQQPAARLQPGTRQQQNQVVVVAYRDPYTGRTFQRQYMVQRPVPTAQTRQQPGVLAQQPRPPAKGSDRPAVELSKANPIGVTTPNLLNSKTDDVRQTSFDAPVLAPQGEKIEYSVLESNSVQGASQIDSSLPILELPNTKEVSEPDSSDFDTTESLDIDLPALGSGN